MMRGKQYWLDTNPNFTVEYGSPIDRTVTSFYTLVSTWVEPEETPSPRKVSDIRKRIKQALYNSLPASGLILKDCILVTADVPEIGLQANKKTYIDFEITTYLNEPTPITDPILGDLAKEISGSTIEVLEGLKGFKFYQSKKS